MNVECTTSESKSVTTCKAPLRLSMAAPRAAQEIEATLMKRDEARAALRERTDQPAAVAKALELNDASSGRRRGKMMLPAPQARALARAGYLKRPWGCAATVTPCAAHLITHRLWTGRTRVAPQAPALCLFHVLGGGRVAACSACTPGRRAAPARRRALTKPA